MFNMVVQRLIGVNISALSVLQTSSEVEKDDLLSFRLSNSIKTKKRDKECYENKHIIFIRRKLWRKATIDIYTVKSKAFHNAS